AVRPREVAMRLLLLSGIPASGKSWFGNWLETHHGFVHIDPEEDTRLRDLGLEASWQVCWQQAACDAFAAAALQLSRAVVLNWGFPAHCLPVVASLKRAGFACWWFDADLAQARQAYLARRKGNPEDFERQMAGINAERQKISSLFESRSLKTLESDGTRLEPKTLW